MTYLHRMERACFSSRGLWEGRQKGLHVRLGGSKQQCCHIRKSHQEAPESQVTNAMRSCPNFETCAPLLRCTLYGIQSVNNINQIQPKTLGVTMVIIRGKGCHFRTLPPLSILLYYFLHTLTYFLLQTLILGKQTGLSSTLNQWWVQRGICDECWFQQIISWGLS